MKWYNILEAWPVCECMKHATSMSPNGLPVPDKEEGPCNTKLKVLVVTIPWPCTDQAKRQRYLKDIGEVGNPTIQLAKAVFYTDHRFRGSVTMGDCLMGGHVIKAWTYLHNVPFEGNCEPERFQFSACWDQQSNAK